eukprot:186199-Rhodomonas_salina.1
MAGKEGAATKLGPRVYDDDSELGPVPANAIGYQTAMSVPRRIQHATENGTDVQHQSYWPS